MLPGTWPPSSRQALFSEIVLRSVRDSPKNSLVPPAVYDLSDHDWIDLEWIREITKAIKIVQEELEGEKYITGSRVIPLLEGVRARLDSTQTHFENTESPSGKFVDLMLFM